MNILTADTGRQAEKIGRSWTHHRTSLPSRNMLLNGNYKYTNTNKNRGWRQEKSTLKPSGSQLICMADILWIYLKVIIYKCQWFANPIRIWLQPSSMWGYTNQLSTRIMMMETRFNLVLHSVILQSQITPERPKIAPGHIRSSQNQSESKQEDSSHS